MAFNSKSLLLSFITYLLSCVLFTAQNLGNSVTMNISQETTTSRSRLLSIVAEVENMSNTNFKGNLHIISPKGLRLVSGDESVIEIRSGEKKFFPVRFIIEPDARAGNLPIRIQLFNEQRVLVKEQIKDHLIEISNELSLNVLNPIIYRSSAQEPLSVKVRVSNNGNVEQDITMVCKIPDPESGNQFLEQQALISIKKDTVFTFLYQPSASLARMANYTVNISGFRNPDKQIFSTATVLTQNISHIQKYQNPQFGSGLEESRNEITASYRKIGEGSNMYQIIGGAGFNLPSGYLILKENIAVLNNQQQPLVTNTNLTYRQGQHEYTIGSVNKMLEMTLVGRGAEYSLDFGKDNRLEFGFVDQNFNLIEKNSFLKYGYGLFAKGFLHTNNSTKNLSLAYIQRYDPFEKSRHHIVGAEGNYALDDKWRINAKINSGLSSYEEKNRSKPSFSAETNYLGVVKDYNISGNYFYSTDYYPGNRRGSIQAQQNISKNIGNYNIFSNILISNFSPKYYFYERSQVSENMRAEIGMKFPKVKNFTFGLIYQHQNENSNSYNNFFGNWESSELRKLSAHRLLEQISWSADNSRQSAILTAETGVVKYPFDGGNKFQMKLNGTYSYRNFNFNTIYQYGSYYLSEFAFAKLTNLEFNYKKLTASLFYNGSFLKDKMNISSGLSYVDDIIYGKSPSAFMNAKYHAKTFSAFFNSSWYRYSLGVVTNNMFTFEVGVTLRFRKAVLNPDKKGKIQLFAFYDSNNNNIFDEDEKPAAGFLVNINNITLKTTEDGKASYNNVPFGKYNLKEFMQKGWYYDESEFLVDAYSYPLQIPLHQNGTLQGKISLEYNAKTALEFEHRTSSISFRIIKNSQVVQRVASDDEGSFTAFLPTGNYTIAIDENSLPENTFCENKTREIQLKAGEITTIPEFIIKVKEKKVNKKTFSN